MSFSRPQHWHGICHWENHVKIVLFRLKKYGGVNFVIPIVGNSVPVEKS